MCVVSKRNSRIFIFTFFKIKLFLSLKLAFGFFIENCLFIVPRMKELLKIFFSCPWLVSFVLHTRLDSNIDGFLFCGIFLSRILFFKLREREHDNLNLKSSEEFFICISWAIFLLMLIIEDFIFLINGNFEEKTIFSPLFFIFGTFLISS